MMTEIIKRNELEKRIENLEEVVDTLCTQVGALTTTIDITPTAIPAKRPNGVHKIGERSYNTRLYLGKQYLRSVIDYGDK